MELLPDTRLPSSWVLERAIFVEETPDAGGCGVCLSGVEPGPQMKSSAGFRLTTVPVDKELKFTCILRGSRCGQTLRVNAFAWNSSSKLRMESTSLVSVEHRSWTTFSCTYVVPEDVSMLTIWIINRSVQSAYVARASLELGATPKFARVYSRDYSTPSDPRAMKVIEANYKACVRPMKEGGHGSVTFPIPGPYRDQVALTFEVKTKPKAALLDYEIRKRDDGINWIAEVRLAPPKKGTIVSWNSLVLVRGIEKPVLPKTIASATPETVPWLVSTKCVQSDDAEIRAKAEDLGRNINDLEAYVRNIIRFTSTNRGAGKKFDSLDAKTALGSGGSCTSRANLAAALLRARGVPARTVAHLPSWMHGKFFEHWLVEYWHPGAGWTWIEPTLNHFQPAPNEVIVLAVSSSDDENLCDDPIHLRYLMPGGAYLSGCELSSELTMGSIMRKRSGPNLAFEQSEIKGTSKALSNLFEAALQHFNQIVQQKNSIDQSHAHSDLIRVAAWNGEADELASLLLVR